MSKTINWKELAVTGVIALTIYAGYRLIRSNPSARYAITQGQMPACDSPPSRHLLVKAIDQSRWPCKAASRSASLAILPT